MKDSILFWIILELLANSHKLSPQGLMYIVSENISVYPNPANDKLVIDGIKQNAIISISDLRGKIIICKKLTTEKKSI